MSILAKDEELLDVLTRIEKLLEPKPAPPPPKGLWGEFVVFLSKYKVMGLAIAFIMGLSLGALVQSLVDDLLMPTIGLLIPGIGNLSTLVVEVNNQQFGIGSFLTALITFIAVALVIFLLVKLTKKWGIE